MIEIPGMVVGVSYVAVKRGLDNDPREDPHLVLVVDGLAKLIDSFSGWKRIPLGLSHVDIAGLQVYTIVRSV